jgi:ABC-type glycerol-3-phosphate transport system substrate-binding protein
MIWVGLLLIGCWGGEEEAAPAPQAAPVELELMTVNVLNNVEEALAKAYMAANPAVKIRLSPTRGGAINALNNPTPPDILVLAAGEQLNNAIDQGLLTDLSEVWEQSDLANSYPAAFRRLSEREGKPFLLPLAYAWNAVYYNKQVFAQYNLQPPRTWDELMEVCETLVINGETPFALAGRSRQMTTLWIDYLNLRFNGSEFHQLLVTGQVAYDQEPRVRLVFETWRSLLERGYFLPDSRNLTTLSSLTALAHTEKLRIGDDKAVMALTGPYFLDEIPEPFRAELGFFPFPTIDPTWPNAETLYAIGYVIPANAAHRPEAMQFLAFLNSDTAREIMQKDVTLSQVYVPAFAQIDDEGIALLTEQGMALVQGAAELSAPFGLSVTQGSFPGLNDFLNEMLFRGTDKPFDLDAALAKLEASRQQQ